MKNTNIYDYLEEYHNISETEENKLLLAIVNYNDIKADSRTNAIEDILIKIRFWVFIVGIAYIVKFIACIIVLILYGNTITAIIKMFI